VSGKARTEEDTAKLAAVASNARREGAAEPFVKAERAA
jgi:hypothetical protein